MATRDRRRQSGQAIVLIAVMMAALVGMVALAIDTGQLLASHRVLENSTDATALAAAQSLQFQSGSTPDWAAAERTAVNLFEADDQLYSGESCSFAYPTGTAAVTSSCSWAAAGYTLAIVARDLGAGGKSFKVSATHQVSALAFAAVNQVSTVQVTTPGSASVADNLALTPALAGLSTSCSGTNPISFVSGSNPVTVVGDMSSNGLIFVGIYSFVGLAGDALGGCAGGPFDPGHIIYRCYPSGAAAPCSGSDVQGSLASNSNRFVDPAYPPPAHPASTGFNSSNVVVTPGAYSVDPQFGLSSPGCYFLAGGTYEWQAGLSFDQGIVSNELKPPDEPVYNNSQARSAYQFWDDNQASCGGPVNGYLTCTATVSTGCSVVLSSGTSAGKGITDGTWSVVVTSTRTATYNGVSYPRESAPSMCHQIAISGPDKTLDVTVANVPGATGYNVYAAPPGGGGCNGPFGLVAVNSIVSSGTQTQGALGSSAGSWNSTTLTVSPAWAPDAAAAADTAKAYPPAAETSPWIGSSSLPNLGPARGASGTAGDRANQDHCTTASGAGATCPAAVTPGAVTMYLTNNSCFNLRTGSTGGDAYLFSGYQYDWILNYEPASTTCANTWHGFANSAAIGMTYTPGASVTISGQYGFSGYTGGVIGNSVALSGASNLLFYWNPNYAPSPPGVRLTGSG